MATIAAGQGKGPQPFMVEGEKTADPARVWQSRDAGRGPAAPKPGAETFEPRHVPDFIAPQLCKSVERPPSGEEWAHEIKFDGYRMQLRVADGGARR